MPITVVDTTLIKYSIQPGPARLYLERHLAPARVGTFRIMDLPTELRLQIYEYTLAYPTLSTVKRAPSGLHNQLWMLTNRRDHDNALPPGYSVFPLPIAPARNVLGLLKTSRGIRAEAQEFFYRRNAFCFDGPVTLGAFVANASTLQLGYLTNSSLHYACPPEAQATLWRNTFARLLLDATSLKHVTVRTNDLQWFSARKLQARSVRTRALFRYTEVRELDGIAELVRLLDRADGSW